MSPFQIHNTRLKCPYGGCRKEFDKPTVLTDSSSFPRQMCYACPHCMSRIDIITENMRIVGIKPTEYPRVFESPAKCARYSGLLTAVSKDVPIPDECLVCPKVLQCNLRKR